MCPSHAWGRQLGREVFAAYRGCGCTYATLHLIEAGMGLAFEQCREWASEEAGHLQMRAYHDEGFPRRGPPRRGLATARATGTDERHVRLDVG